jgi:hypothetical protein
MPLYEDLGDDISLLWVLLCLFLKTLMKKDVKTEKVILEKKQLSARKKGRFVNPLFFQARITRISSFTIRTAQSAIITGRSLVDVLRSLIRQLVPRPDLIEEH